MGTLLGGNDRRRVDGADRCCGAYHPHEIARIVVNAAGYRGDVLPYVPIGAELGRRGHAAVAILSRDRGGPPLARQILLYPMLDDRTTTPDSEIVPFADWTYDDNITGWNALLGERVGDTPVDPTAAPSRLTDATGLPPAYAT